MLHFLLQLALLVLRNLGVLFLPPEQLDAVAADIADRDARLLGVFRGNTGQFAPPFLVQIGDRNPDDLTLGLGIEPQTGFADRLVDRLHHRAVPHLDRDHPRLRYADIRQLVARHGSAVGADGNRFEQAGRSPPGPQTAELLAQHLDCPVHPSSEVLQQIVFRHSPRPVQLCPLMIVYRPRPIKTSANPPFSKIENTRIGMWFSRASEIAEASITRRSRERTSK